MNLKIKISDDVDWNINERKYSKDELLIVTQLEGNSFKNYYAHYYDGNLDWIPKHCTEIV